MREIVVVARSRGEGSVGNVAYLGLTSIGLIVGLVFVLSLSAGTAVDAHAYWVADLSYQHTNGDTDAFLYAPPFAQLITPLRLLPWPDFIVVWRAITVAALAVAAGPWTLVVLAFPQVRDELTYANINVLLGLAVVAMVRRPWLWSLLPLTKITPAVSILWFVGRRDARGLAIALLATLAVVAVSFVIDPAAWGNYVRFVSTGTEHARPLSNGGQLYVDLPLRLGISATLALWAGLRRQRWALVIASWFALPVLWSATFAMLAPVPAILVAQIRVAIARRELAAV